MGSPLTERIRAKYPGAYDDMDDAALEAAVLAKYPEYKDLATPEDSIGYRGMLSSVVPPKQQASVVGSILGHDVPAKPEAAMGLSDMLAVAKEAGPLKAVGSAALGLTGIPQMIELGKTAVEAGPDILRGLISNPLETLRGGAAGVAEGVMQQATPANALLSAIPFLRNYIKNRPVPVPNPLGVRTGTAGTAAIPPPAGPVPFTGPMPPPVTRPPLASGTAGVNKLPLPTGPTPFSAPAPAPVARPPLASGTSFTPAALPKAPAASAAPYVPRTLAAGEEAGINALDKLQEAIHGADVPTKGNGTFSQFAELMGGKGAVISDAKKADAIVDASLRVGNVNGAANVIQERVKFTVAELAKDYRAGYGSEKADKLLGLPKGATKRLAPGPSRRPLAAEMDDLDASFRRLVDSERGGVGVKTVAAIGGGAAGAAYGGTQGDDADERIVNAAMYGAGGAVALPLLAHIFASASPVKTIQNFTFSAILSSPQSAARAFLGGTGGALGKAAEMLAAGDPRGGKILASLFNDGFVRGIVRAAKHPKTAAVAGEGLASELPTVTGRIFDAVNEPSMRAMMKAGISREEAMRYTLAGLPRTDLGRSILNLWNRFFVLKALGNMFPRVGVQLLEHGIERSPLGLVSPTTMGKLGLGGLNEGAAGARAAKAGLGSGAGLAAYMGSDEVPDWSVPYLIALSGVYALPVAAMLAAGKAADKGKDINAQATAALEPITATLPFARYGPMESAKQIASGSTFVPNVFRDVARFMDPHDRRSEGFFGRTKAKIPGLRETLPIRPDPVNAAGKLIDDRSSPFKRSITNPPRGGDPTHAIDETVVKETRRLGIELKVPTARALVVGTQKVDIPPNLLNRYREEKAQFLIPRIQKAMNTPRYRKATDAGKKRMIETAIELANEQGAQKARATVVQSLKEASRGR